MKQMLITTTPTLTNAKILHYYGIVTANVVIGVNFFSDFKASFSDFFGGTSGTYEKKLDLIYNEVIKGLQAKAMRRNANAIIGLHIDFDEISGKGKQMFMATAVGTACKVEFTNNTQINQIGQESFETVSNIAVEQLCKLRYFQEELKDENWVPSENDWEYIISHNMTQLAPLLVGQLFTIDAIYKADYFEDLKRYMILLSYSEGVEAVYPYLENQSDDIFLLIDSFMLFNADKVLEQLDKGNISIAIELLNKSKEYYDLEDLQKMEQIIERIDNLPDKGKIEKVVSGVFTKKEEEMYICPEGHKNSKDDKFCTKDFCGLNIKGLVLEQTEIISNFKTKVLALSDIINR